MNYCSQYTSNCTCLELVSVAQLCVAIDMMYSFQATHCLSKSLWHTFQTKPVCFLYYKWHLCFNRPHKIPTPVLIPTLTCVLTDSSQNTILLTLVCSSLGKTAAEPCDSEKNSIQSKRHRDFAEVINTIMLYSEESKQEKNKNRRSKTDLHCYLSEFLTDSQLKFCALA